jgi:hypothetical protein
MQNFIYSYIRDDNGKRLGIFYGEKVNNGVQIGYSLVNYKKGDKFDLEIGIKEAKEKAPVCWVEIPEKLRNYYASFLVRCSQYYKTEKIFIGYVSSKDLRKSVCNE